MPSELSLSATRETTHKKRMASPAERAVERLLARITIGSVSVTLPGGRVLSAKGELPGPSAHLTLNRMRMLRRLAWGGDIGFAESYIDGDCDSPDLAALVELALRNERAGELGLDAGPIRRAINRAIHVLRANTRRGSRRNIAAHYDLGNDFYRLWLDDSMTYSAGMFASPDQPLRDAQTAKYRHLADMLGLKPGMEVLEIGCGWGGFAEIAARDYGCRVTALTLSQQQKTYAEARMARAGLSDRVEILLRDYRDEAGRYDAIASIEMFEAVGERYWPIYFDSLDRCLKPGAKAALQVITIEDDRFERYRAGADFIQRYVFPGGMLPSPSVFRSLVESKGFRMERDVFFGLDYARTLALWNQSFQKHWPEIEAQGYDRRFKRLWEFYLAYCEGGFRTGSIDVGQFLLARG